MFAGPHRLSGGAIRPGRGPRSRCPNMYRLTIGAPVAEFGRPLVTNLQIVDLDRDGLADVLYCEGQKNTVRWIRQSPRGVFTEQTIGEDILAPAHVWAAEVNGSGRLDVLVASMGQITPNNDRIGAVVVLENLDNQHFRRRVLVDHVARVTDVRGANLAGHKDGKLDLVVRPVRLRPGRDALDGKQGRLAVRKPYGEHPVGLHPHARRRFRRRRPRGLRRADFAGVGGGALVSQSRPVLQIRRCRI